MNSQISAALSLFANISQWISAVSVSVIYLHSNHLSIYYIIFI